MTTYALFFVTFMCSVVAIEKSFRLYYINDFYTLNDRGEKRLRKGALAEYEIMRFTKDFLNTERPLKYRHGITLDVEKEINSTEYLNVRLLNIYIHSHNNPSEKLPAVYLNLGSIENVDLLYGVNKAFDTPVVTSYATFSKYEETFKESSFIRILPSDVYKVDALVRLIDYFGWNYLTLLISRTARDHDAFSFLNEVINPGRERVVCVAQHVIFEDKSHQYYCDIVKNLNESTKLNVLIFFTTKAHTRSILSCMRKFEMYGRFTLVFFYAWNNDIDVYEENEILLDGAIGIEHTYLINLDEFKKRFSLLNPKTQPNYSLLKAHWQVSFNCNAFYLEGRNPDNYARNCTFNETLNPDRHLHLSALGAHVSNELLMTHSLIFNVLKEKCLGTTCRNIDKIIPTIRSDFENYARRYLPPDNYMTRQNFIQYNIINSIYDNQSAKFYVKQVGTWKLSRDVKTKLYPSQILRNGTPSYSIQQRIWWGKKLGFKTPSGVCMDECKTGEIYIYNYLDICCWKCAPCKKNQIVLNNKCVPCPDLYRPDNSHVRCVRKIEKFFYKTPSFVLRILLAFCMCIALVFVYPVFSQKIFLYSKALWVFVLAGVIISFVASFLYTLPASKTVCILRVTLPSMGLVFSYVSLCLKCFMTQDKLLGGIKNSYTRKALGKNPYNKLTGILYTIHLIILASQFAIYKIDVLQRTLPTFFSTHCKGDANPLLFLVYLFALFMSLYKSYQIRCCHVNYREPRTILITMCISVSIMVAALAIYLSSYIGKLSEKHPYMLELTLAWFYFFNGLSLVCGLFFQKMFIMVKKNILESKVITLISIYYFDKQEENEEVTSE